MPKLQTSTLSNQNISTALLVGTYTADREYSSLMIRVFADQVGGNGDYKIHLTHQIGGAGSAYKSAVTTETLSSGETAHMFGSILMPVNSGDVIRVYVQGLAGDTTTPDIICEFWDLGYLRPATAGRTLGVDASGKVDVTGLDASLLDVAVSTRNATAPDNASIAAIKVKTDNLPTDPADESLLEAAIAAIDVGDVWSAPVRTLTSSAVAISGVSESGEFVVKHGDTMVIDLTGLGSLANISKLFFTVKNDVTVEDSQAIIQIEKTDGLKYLNGAAATSAHGSLTVLDAVDGDIRITLDASEVEQIALGTFEFDVQIVRSTGTPVSTLTEGAITFVHDVTKTIS